MDLQARACRIQGRALSRLVADVRTEARRKWLAGAAELAASDEEARRRRSRTAHAMQLVFDREVGAASVELKYELSLGDPWPTGVLEVLVGVDEPVGRRALGGFRQVPTAALLRAAIKRVDASTQRGTMSRYSR